MPAAIAITGASGFIGGHTARAAADLPGAGALRLAVHRRPLPFVPKGRYTSPGIDLQDPGSLRGLCTGADALLHCASQIDGTAQTAHAVNVDGTERLMDEAVRAGVPRIVYLSTASVYGRGTYRNARPAGLPVRPGSATSRTRAEAERIVLAAGGIVLRPYLVYGAGDTWAVPGLIRLLRESGQGVANGPALLSLIDAADLGRALAALATAPAGDVTSAVYHANHPVPVSCAALVRAVARLDPEAASPARSHADNGGGPERAAFARATAMITSDHWFESETLWRDTGCDPGPGFAARFDEHTDWYVSLRTATAG